jgi:hypothetical protein
MLKVLKEEKIVVSRGRNIEISGPDQFRKIEKEVSIFI